jgi:hypothetical protein
MPTDSNTRYRDLLSAKKNYAVTVPQNYSQMTAVLRIRTIFCQDPTVKIVEVRIRIPAHIKFFFLQ